ncbi:helix-turn-helix domain-containing protein [Propionicimonas sp.]|uniref:helix-turn-helix domain-containing protein n=1 Tax=Propionicimonas sp. TaxID=1955623 RepID=UPI0039E36964
MELARLGLSSSGSPTDGGLAGAVAEPTRRNRTPLTAHQIDAIQTARDSGESVMSIARRFGVSRMTVWDKTRTR